MVPGGRRELALDRLAEGAFDLVVIGAGAIGAATAWHAAAAGARVAVVDRGDIAGATSGASSKLLPGGLRSLAMGDLRLVGQAHAERRAHARVIAPHLVRPLDFVVPVGRDSVQPLWKLRAGVFLYGALSGFGDGRSGAIPVADARVRVPGLAVARLGGAVLYHDHQTHDARLTLAALQAAAGRGAVVVPHAEVVGLRSEAGRVRGVELVDRLGGGRLSVPAGIVVNASGPWVDRVRRLEDPAAGTTVRLSKGAHLVLEGGEGWTAAVTTPLPGGRVSFALPWEGMLLLGTTDEDYDGDPGDVRATDADQAQILGEAARSLAPDVVAPARVRSRFAGLRVLPVSGRATSRERRDVVIGRGPGGMVSVAGGKLTTWRLIGARAARLALGELGMHVRRPRPAPVPGAARLDAVEGTLARDHPELDAAVRRHLAHHYGMAALDVLAPVAERPGLAERIDPRGPDIWAQVVHAREHEWAATVDDVLRTRTTVALRGLDGEEVRRRAAGLLAAPA
jgi:glycerol-3-phosphate dehydrogenase